MSDTPEHILSLSYGKDSLACLGAIEQLGWPLDRIEWKAPDGYEVHDYDERFRLEDEGLIPESQPFRWSVLDETQLTADWYITHGGEHHDQR